MKQLLLLTTLFVALHVAANAQSNNPWRFVHEKDFKVQGERSTIPSQYQTTKLGMVTLKNTLNSAPPESFDGKKSDVKLSLPMPDGSFEEFYISESSVMDPKLAKQFPEIKSYVGAGVQHPSTYLRFDLTPHGFHAIVLAAEGNTVYIEPYAKGEKELYMSYYNKDVPNKASEKQNFIIDEVQEPVGGADMVLECGIIRTYRLVVAATGEFTAASGGTTASAMAAINTLVMYANGIFEKELHARFIIVASNSLVVYTNGNTDPYSVSTLLADENQAVCDAYFPGAYDVGFLVHKKTDGVQLGSAVLNKVCTTLSQARAFVGETDPLSARYRQLMISNLGFQFGAAFSFNHTDCGSGFNGQSVETGAGSTIMSGAGICNPGYQNYADTYFSGANLMVLKARVLGHTCPVDISTANAAPTVSAGPDRTFPNSTKFVLNAVGSDDGNALTYCWEQIDSEIAPSMPPSSTATIGPVFRSYPPTSVPDRRFPRFGASGTWEKVPTVARSLHFKVTARDNSPYGGCTDDDDMTVAVDGTAGPFVVTSPNNSGFNGGVPLCPSSNLTVTWLVAGTNLSPVNCTSVDILLSTSSGNSYGVLLASNTPNDGSEVINLSQFSNILSLTCRIMVRSHWSDGTTNYFYDDSDADFAIDYAPVTYLNGSHTPSSLISNVCTNTYYTLQVISPCNLPITMFIPGNPIPPYVTYSWDASSGIFKFYFSQPGTFAVTFRVSTLAGNYDRVCVFYAQDCRGGGLVSPNEPGSISDHESEIIDERINLKNLALDAYSDEFVKLYPNPVSSSGNLTLEIPNTQGLSRIAIYDVTGVLLKEMETADFRLTLNLSSFTPGTYFVKVSAPLYSVTKKFVISD